jgi:hypothetical protein
LVPDDDIHNSGIAYTKGYVQAITMDDQLTVEPDISSVQGDTVTFQDGASQAFDIIVCGTGYKGMDLSIFPEKICQEVKYINPGKS